MRIAQEEIFGPVLSTIAFDELDDAIAIANDTMYGLAAAIWTDDLSTAHSAARALRAGVVWVNCSTRATSRRRSAASSSRASVATSRCTRSRSTPT